MSNDNKKRLEKVVQVDDRRIRDHLGELVRGTVEETLNAMLDASAPPIPHIGLGRVNNHGSPRSVPV